MHNCFSAAIANRTARGPRIACAALALTVPRGCATSIRASTGQNPPPILEK